MYFDLPVCELDKLDRVGLDVNSKVGQMTASVKDRLEEDEEPNKFVEINVVVKREDCGQPEPPEDGDGVPEDEGKHEARVEVEHSAAGSGQKIKWIRSQSAEHGEVAEIISTVDKEDDVYQKDHKNGGVQTLVIAPVFLGHVSLR